MLDGVSTWIVAGFIETPFQGLSGFACFTQGVALGWYDAGLWPSATVLIQRI
jgi:hypothetical protein